VTGWSVEKIAADVIELMDRLRVRALGAQGGDWGSRSVRRSGARGSATLTGIHVTRRSPTPAKLIELGGPNEEEQRYLARLQRSTEAEGGYAIEQGTKPQTLGYGLTDSPVGSARVGSWRSSRPGRIAR